MSGQRDFYLARLEDELRAARSAEIPNLVDIRDCKARFIEYLAMCVLEEMESRVQLGPRGPRLDVFCNDGPVRQNPRRMSSPVKTDDIRAFENRVSRVFGVTVSATTEWHPGVELGTIRTRGTGLLDGDCRGRR